MANQIDQYALGRYANGTFAYRVKFIGGGWANWTAVSAAEFAAFAALFNTAPLYAHPDGSITTGAEPIGN
ncbi:MAG: hypothetical protein QM706_20805 [Nitrospira sp.]